MQQVYIGLGSNLSEPKTQIRIAIDSLNALPDTRVMTTSSLYSSSPLGPQDQPDFVNAVCQIETRLLPEQLLEALQLIELNQGRVKKRHWGERLIDLDILVYGDVEMQSESLTIPHMQLALRDFVLVPLAEIAPNLDIPGLPALSVMIDDLNESYLYSLPQ